MTSTAGSALASASTSVVIVPVIVAVTDPTTGALGFNGTGGKGFVEFAELLALVLLAERVVLAATRVLIWLIGMIRKAKESKHETNTLRLLGGQKDESFTVFCFLGFFVAVSNLENRAADGKAQKPFR